MFSPLRISQARSFRHKRVQLRQRDDAGAKVTLYVVSLRVPTRCHRRDQHSISRSGSVGLAWTTMAGEAIARDVPERGRIGLTDRMRSKADPAEGEHGAM
ncbi:hypothetical protein PHSY_001569 [Pseudozyma hubeiensis SY62]|uniref:Uncharacterized protein n=1 Tax=Pseudozyma hubeiensis (strain SY62) TaxID=1305764 RepID=R9P7C7_PSEHS|nr:hypothetical protein PHSY_001569 [Pseudozyma hubeiensis SY62]GAC94000.1 hypothetical protein PHSY_001569 [Pseudozyma hubeiensis SY62]